MISSKALGLSLNVLCFSPSKFQAFIYRSRNRFHRRRKIIQ